VPLPVITFLNPKWTSAVVVVVGAGVAGWWGTSQGSVVPEGTDLRVTNPAAIDAQGEALAGEISRLHDERLPRVTIRRHGRDLFSFVSPKRRPRHDVRRPDPGVHVLTPASGLAAGNPAPLPTLKLSGIAEDATPNGFVRTAIISGLGQLFLAKEGEQVTERYRVVRISPEVVELIDIQNGTTVRLALP
jgi:hypothetical protein